VATVTDAVGSTCTATFEVDFQLDEGKDPVPHKLPPHLVGGG
jgi:hypothetical protein